VATPAIEQGLRRSGHDIAAAELPRVRLHARRFTPLREVAHTLFGVYRRRALVGLTLMVAQAFFYNAIHPSSFELGLRTWPPTLPAETKVRWPMGHSPQFGRSC